MEGGAELVGLRRQLPGELFDPPGHSLGWPLACPSLWGVRLAHLPCHPAGLGHLNRGWEWGHSAAWVLDVQVTLSRSARSPEAASLGPSRSPLGVPV